MKTKQCILAIDQGTTFTKTYLFDRNLNVVAGNTGSHTQIRPHAGWVEHDAREILGTTIASIRATLRSAGVRASEIAAVGIANQGETVVAWDASTGAPLYHAIVWQDRRTEKMCEVLRADPSFARNVRSRTGLHIDPYFSATKVAWLSKHVLAIRRAASRKRLMVGTMDSWLIWNLSGRKSFVTDPSTASRTLLFNIRTLRWDVGLLNRFGIDRTSLPDVLPSQGVCGTIASSVLGAEVPIAALLCDQQAALLGHGCLKAGQAKCTYGTGAFFLLNLSNTGVRLAEGLLTSIAWSMEKNTHYVFDGGVYSAGSAVDWLKNGLGIIATASETQDLATSVDSAGGVIFVPALHGLASPYWNSSVRACFLGLNARTTRAHLARAVLEGIAYRIRDICETMNSGWSRKIESLSVDGGLTRNTFLMQFQSDILGIPIRVPHMSESTSLGVAYLAGLAVGFFKGEEVLHRKNRAGRVFLPRLTRTERDRMYGDWKRAVRAAEIFARRDGSRPRDNRNSR